MDTDIKCIPFSLIAAQMGFPYLIAVAYKYFTRGSDV